MLHLSFLLLAQIASADVAVPTDAGAPEPAAADDAGVVAAPTDGGTVVADGQAVSDVFALFETNDDVHVRLRLGFLTEWGNHPHAPLGLSLGTRIGSRRWGGVIEVWGLLPESIGDTTETGSLSVFSFGATVGGCHEIPVLSGVFLGCVLGRGGVMHFEPRNVPDLSPTWQPIGSAGLRFGAEWPRESFLAFYVTAHGFVPFLRGYLRGSTVGWAQSWVYGGAQIGFRLRWQ